MKKLFFCLALAAPLMSFARDTSYVKCVEGSSLEEIASKFNDLTTGDQTFHTINFKDRLVTIKNQKIISGLTILEDGKYSNGQKKIVACATVAGEGS